MSLHGPGRKEALFSSWSDLSLEHSWLNLNYWFFLVCLPALSLLALLHSWASILLPPPSGFFSFLFFKKMSQEIGQSAVCSANRHFSNLSRRKYKQKCKKIYGECNSDSYTIAEIQKSFLVQKNLMILIAPLIGEREKHSLS